MLSVVSVVGGNIHFEECIFSDNIAEVSLKFHLYNFSCFILSCSDCILFRHQIHFVRRKGQSV